MHLSAGKHLDLSTDTPTIRDPAAKLWTFIHLLSLFSFLLLSPSSAYSSSNNKAHFFVTDMSTATAPPVTPGDYRLLLDDDCWPIIVIDDMMAAEFSLNPRPGASAVPILLMGSSEMWV